MIIKSKKRRISGKFFRYSVKLPQLLMSKKEWMKDDQVLKLELRLIIIAVVSKVKKSKERNIERQKERWQQVFGQHWPDKSKLDVNQHSLELIIQCNESEINPQLVYKLLKENGMDVLMPEKHEKTFIFLHGAANQAAMYHNLFLSSYSPVCQNTKIILPQAPMKRITFSKKDIKMPSWYDILTEDRINKRPHELYNLNDLEESATRIQEIIKHEQQLLKDPKQLYLGGISQGCALALYSGLSFEKRIGGIIALSGYYIDTCKVSKENSDTPIYFSHGTADEIVKVNYMEQTIKFLQYVNPNFTMEYEEGLGHSINEEQMQKLQGWFTNISEHSNEQSL